MKDNSQLTFESVDCHGPGIVERLLAESYAALSDEFKDLLPSHFDWYRADREVFENPRTIGACTFITCLGGKPIGLGSFDPRQRPELGIVGHNCVVPAYCGRGYGKRQLQEIVSRLRALEIHTAQATTANHPFFLAAQKMYLACGFHEAKRRDPTPDRPFAVIDYHKPLI